MRKFGIYFVIISLVSLSGFSQELDWAIEIGSFEKDYARDVEVDSEGNVFVVGYFEETVDFDPGAGVTTLTAFDERDMFVLKLDPEGNFLWVKHFSGPNHQDPEVITIDSTGSPIISGTTQNPVDFDPGSGTLFLDGQFIIKLTPDGDLDWGYDPDFGINGLDVGADNYIYCSGAFKNTTDMDPGSGVFNLTSVDINDGYISKLNPFGDLVWVRQLSGDLTQTVQCITVLDSIVYAGGRTWGTADFDPGPGTYSLSPGVYDEPDAFVEKLDTAGNFLWARLFQGSGEPSEANDVTISEDNAVYFTGQFVGTVDFDSGSGVYDVTSTAGTADGFLVKLSTLGELEWVENLGGTSGGAGMSVRIAQDGGIYYLGSFNGTIDVDPGTGMHEYSSSVLSSYLGKYKSDGSLQWAKLLEGSQGDEITVYQNDVYVAGDYELGLIFEDGPTFSADGPWEGYLAKYIDCTALGLDVSYGDGFLTAESSSALSYQWIDCNNDSTAIPGETSSTYYPPQNGSYAVIVDHGSGCIDTSDCYEVTDLGWTQLPEDISGLGCVVYPNPTNGDFRVKFETPFTGTLSAYDLTGKLVLSQPLYSVDDTRLNLPGERGFYLLQFIREDGKVITRKLQKMTSF